MAEFVNPLSAVAGFRNQQLSGVLNRQGSTPSPTMRTAQESLDAGTPDLSGMKNASSRATRQHNMYLVALKAQQQRQARQSRPQPSYSSGGGYRSTNSGGAMGGRYNLIGGADRALSALDAAYRKQFGYGLTVNSGGRSYQDQVIAYQKYLNGGNLAAKPGTSVHESGRAVDFGGAIQNANSREHRWLQANAGRFGWKWTGKNFSQFEPWHWEWWG